MITAQMEKLRNFIADFTTKNGYCPSYREMADGMQTKSIAQIHRMLAGLEKYGLIKRRFARARAIEVVEPPADAPPVMVVENLRGAQYRITEKGHAFIKSLQTQDGEK